LDENVFDSLSESRMYENARFDVKTYQISTKLYKATRCYISITYQCSVRFKLWWEISISIFTGIEIKGFDLYNNTYLHRHQIKCKHRCGLFCAKRKFVVRMRTDASDVENCCEILTIPYIDIVRNHIYKVVTQSCFCFAKCDFTYFNQVNKLIDQCVRWRSSPFWAL
jgi:hypothetical protein